MEKPLGKALVLCEQVIEDKRSGNKSLIGIFNRITAARFPARHHSLAVYVTLVNGSGSIPVELRLSRGTQSKKMLSAKGEVAFANPNQVIELVFDLKSIVFEAPDQYLFEVFANSEYIFETKFDVVLQKRSS